MKSSSLYIIRNSIKYTILFLFAGFIVIPFSWMLATSLRSPVDSFKLPPSILPTTFILDNYRLVFEKVNFLGFFQNSLRVAILMTGLQLVISSMAAYAFGRLNFPFKQGLFLLFLSAMMIPSQVTNIPRFIFLSKLRLIDTHLALILPGGFSAFAIFLLRQQVLSIPHSFDDAASIDGANRLWIFLRIIVPMTKPSLMVIAVMTFISSWNDFYTPLIYLNTQSKMTLPLGFVALQSMVSAINQSAVIAAVILSLAAPLVFYIAGQRYLIEGISIGGIKG